MSSTSAVPGRTLASAWLRPSSLILLGANLVPLAGVFLWGWDAFVLLMLYWLETAILGFWMIVRIATAPRGSVGELTSGDAPPGSGSTSPLGLTLFFTVHAGMFMLVHFIFLWVLFSGDWPRQIHGPVDFVSKLVIGTGLWLPLLVLFLARGASLLYQMYAERFLAWAHGKPAPLAPPAEAGSQAMSVLGGFYGRVIAMHIAILAGGFLSFFGTIAPLVILIAMKTAVDLGFHVAVDLGDSRKAAGALFGRQPAAS